MMITDMIINTMKRCVPKKYIINGIFSISSISSSTYVPHILSDLVYNVEVNVNNPFFTTKTRLKLNKKVIVKI